MSRWTCRSLRVDTHPHHTRSSQSTDSSAPPAQHPQITRTDWHTLSVNPERWSKRSSFSAHSPWEGCETVNCLHNLHSLTLFFFFFLFLIHLCFPSARLSITGRLLWWLEGRRAFCNFNGPSHRRTLALTYLDQSHILLSWHLTKMYSVHFFDVIESQNALRLLQQTNLISAWINNVLKREYFFSVFALWGPDDQCACALNIEFNVTQTTSLAASK